jgi:hypothetical protein
MQNQNFEFKPNQSESYATFAVWRIRESRIGLEKKSSNPEFER